MSKFYDISVPLTSSLVSWPGEKGFSRAPQKGPEAEVSRLELGSHIGTHIDAPKHFVRGGTSVDNLPLESLIGDCLVVEIKHNGQITARDINQLGQGRARVLFKTSNTSRRLLEKAEFAVDFVSLDESAAQAIVKQGMKLVGVDYLSVEAKGAAGHPVHNILLKAGVVCLEGCNLVDVPAGHYKIYALPLRIEGGDGAPARVILEITNDQ